MAEPRTGATIVFALVASTLALSSDAPRRRRPADRADSPPFAARRRPRTRWRPTTPRRRSRPASTGRPLRSSLAHLHLLARTDDGDSAARPRRDPGGLRRGPSARGREPRQAAGGGVLPSHLARERGRALGERVRDLLLGAQLVVRRGAPADRPRRRVAARGRRDRRDRLPRQRHLRRIAPGAGLVAARPVDRARTEGPGRRKEPLRFGLGGKRSSPRMVGARGLELAPVLRPLHPHRQPVGRGAKSATWTTGRRASTSSGSTTSGATGRSRARRAGARRRCSSREGAPESDLRASYLLVSRRSGAGGRRSASTSSATANPTTTP